MKIETTVEVSPQLLAYMLVTAVEGGSAYWCNGVYWQSADSEPLVTKEHPWYSDPSIWEREDFRIEVVEDDGEGHFVRLSDVKEGLDLMAKTYPHHFADMIAENFDATTADVFLQCIALKELVYG